MGDPEKIWAVFEDHVNPKDMRPYVYASAAPTKGKPYIPESLAQAMVAAAYEDAATYWQKRGDAGNGAPYMAPSIMRKRTPDDARAALAARDKRVREDALREVAALIGVKIGHDGEIGNCQCGKCNARRDDHAEILALIDRTAEGDV